MASDASDSVSAHTVIPPHTHASPSLTFLTFLTDTTPLPAALLLSFPLSPPSCSHPWPVPLPRIYLPRALIFHHVIMSLFPTTSVSRRRTLACTLASDKNGRESSFAPKSDYKHGGPPWMNRCRARSFRNRGTGPWTIRQWTLPVLIIGLFLFPFLLFYALLFRVMIRVVLLDGSLFLE